MSELRNLIPSTWIEWIQQHPQWLLAVLGGALFLFILFRLNKREQLRGRLPFDTSFEDWKTFQKHYQPRRLTPSGTRESISDAEYLQKILRIYRSDLAHSFVILCPPGSGRTWLLYRFAALLKRRSQKWIMRSLLEEGVLQELTGRSAKGRTWLLLDDLESLSPELQARERLEMILEATQDFKGVIMVANHDRWPSGWKQPDQQGRIKLAGEDHFAWATSAWLIDRTADQAQRQYKRQIPSFHQDGARRMIDGIDWRNPIWARPAIIRILGSGAGMKGASRFIFQAINSCLQKVIGETGDEAWWEKLDQLAAGQFPEATHQIPQPLQAVLIKTRSDQIAFRHRFFQGYFLALKATRIMEKATLREVRSHPEAKYLYLEMVWKEFLDSSRPEAGSFLTLQGKAVSLRSITVDLLPSIRFLLLPELHQQDFRFLRFLPELERIWVEKGSPKQFHQIFDHWRPRHGSRVYVKSSTGEWSGVERFYRYGESKRWDHLQSWKQYHPALASDQVISRREFSPLSRLFRLDPHKLPNPLCKEIQLPNLQNEGVSKVYELSLEAGEFELFDKVFICEFETGDIHLQYLHSRPQATLHQNLPEILEKWTLFAGPDDEGKRELTQAEKLDLQQGSWSGRRWTQQTDTLGFQALIQMVRPGHVEIWIRTGRPDPITMTDSPSPESSLQDES